MKPNKTLSPSHSQKKTIGENMHHLISRLYPICRSITGNGVRKTLNILKDYIPLKIHEIPSGTAVFDWKVPKEWNIKEAYIKDSKGNKIIDFQDHSLHILNYSIPIKGKFTLEELKPHLYTLPDQPELIPYRTSYYRENWGFCLPHRQLENLREDIYEINIDSSLDDGFLSYGELFLPGTSAEEVLISTHICHPSLCNDNLSGIAVCTFLAQYLLNKPHKYSYRFLFVPGTIGAISWLALNESRLGKIKHGLVASLLGDEGNFTYKRSRRANAEIDQIVPFVLSQMGKAHKVIDFVPYGYDERQYGSPGINLPVGCLTRSTYGTFPAYHTSADNLDFVKAQHLGESLEVYCLVVDTLDDNRYYLNQNPKCEPQLGRRGLYALIGGQNDSKQFQLAILWVLNLSDGSHSLLEIAEKSSIDFSLIVTAAKALEQHQLLKEIQDETH